jgi:hypothetical protein
MVFAGPLVYTHRAFSGTLSRGHLVNPLALQLLHFRLEILHLLPAIQRPTVVLREALDHLAARRLYLLRERADLLPLLELLAELTNLFADGEPIGALLGLFWHDGGELLVGGGKRL